MYQSERSDVEEEQNRGRETQKTNQRKDENLQGKSQVIKNPLIGWPLSRTEESLALKLPKKTRNKKSKRTAPGSTVKRWKNTYP